MFAGSGEQAIKMGVMANVNPEIEEIAQILATDLGFQAELTSNVKSVKWPSPKSKML